MYGSISSRTLANTTDTVFTEQQYMQNHFNEELKAKAINLINFRNDKQKHQEHKQQLQCNRQQLDYNYEFKTQRIPRVQNKGNDYVHVNTNKGTIIVDNKATTVMMNSHKNYATCKMFTPNLYRNNWIINRGCGGSNIGANCSNCRNIKILLRLSLRYFYDINCEFVKNII